MDIDLNELLTESVQLKEAERAERARVKAKTQKPPRMQVSKPMKSKHTSRTSASTQEDAEDEIEDRNLRARWLPVASVAMFNVQHCTHCNSEHSHFQGIFQHQRSQAFTSMERWVKDDEIQSAENLPRAQKTNVYHTDMCATCIPERTW